MMLADDGSLYWSSTIGVNDVIKVVDPLGRVRTINSSQTNCEAFAPYLENGTIGFNCIKPNGLAFHPNGDLLFADGSRNRIFKISPALPGFTAQQQILPSEDGSVLYVFDSSGRHTETRNALTNAVVFTFAYDPITGKLNSVTDGDGDATTIQRDPVTGNPVSITSQDGQITTLTLDANGYIATVANPNSETFQMGYDAGGLMTAFTRPKALTDPDPLANYTTTVTYDALGLMDRDTGADNGFLQTVRTEDADGYTVSATTAEGRLSTFRVEEDAQGTTIRTNRIRTKIGTDPITDPDEWLVTVTEERNNGIVLTTTPDGTVTFTVGSPDPRFGMIAPLSRLGVRTPSGLASNITPGRTVTQNATTGALLTQSDTLNINGRVFTSDFNASLLRSIDTSPIGRTSTSFTDAQGRIVEQQIPGIFNTDFAYDLRGRLTDVVQGDGTPAIDRTSSIVYNAAGFIDNITDPVGRVVRFEYDLVGRVKKQILPDLREINFTYDANGNVESITPPGRPLHGFDYTNVDLEDIYTPPDPSDIPINDPPLPNEIKMPETFFSYNLDKQLTEILRPDLKKINMAYDAGGRLETVTLRENPDDPLETKVYTYAYFPDLDPNVFAGNEGNLEKITAPDGGTLTFMYDGSLLLSSTWGGTSPVTGSVSRTYDNDFRITSRSVNGANTISFGYDNDSLLTSAGAETLDYDPIDPGTGLPITNGLFTGTTLGVVTDSYQYNLFGEVSNYAAQVSAVDQFATSFVRDKLGRITQKTETVQGVTHTFDYLYNDAGYLVEVKRDTVVTATYTYDLNGNRLTNVDSTKTLTGEYDDQDRLLKLTDSTDPLNPVEYIYTDNGELLTKTENGQVTSHTYDVLGNLKQVVLPSGTVIDYLIDGSNRRIGKKVDGVLQKGWLYKDRLNLIAELDGSGNVVSRFVYASDENIPDYVIKGGTTFRIISDHLGSPRLVVDISTGAIVQELEYDAWGNVLLDTNQDFLPFGFAGGLYDTDTKLIRFGARDYDPEAGRWTAKDPIRFDSDGPNLYGYVLNDPINFFDKTGLGKIKVVKKLSKKVWKKIRGKHHDPKVFKKASKFSKEGLKSVEEATAKTTLRPDKITRQIDGRRVCEKAFDKVLGNKGEKILRVILDETGKVISAFPVKNFKTIIPGATLGVDFFGDNIFGGIADFINPLSDIQDITDLVNGEEL